VVENDGTNSAIRVARLNSGVSATSGGINESTTRDGQDPTLIAVGTTPYVG